MGLSFNRDTGKIIINKSTMWKPNLNLSSNNQIKAEIPLKRGLLCFTVQLYLLKAALSIVHKLIFLKTQIYLCLMTAFPHDMLQNDNMKTCTIATHGLITISGIVLWPHTRTLCISMLHSCFMISINGNRRGRGMVRGILYSDPLNSDRHQTDMICIEFGARCIGQLSFCVRVCVCVWVCAIQFSFACFCCSSMLSLRVIVIVLC